METNFSSSLVQNLKLDIKALGLVVDVRGFIGGSY
jgi:hypothetical protein